MRTKREADVPTKTLQPWASPHPFYRFASVIGLNSGIAGWVIASMYRSMWVPFLAGMAILLGLLGVRSQWRALAVVGFVMGMFLLPNAIGTVIRLLGS